MDKTARLDELIDGAEELLTQLSDAHNPEVQRLRDRVDHAIGDARRVLEQQLDGPSVRLRDVAGSVDDYIRDYPWLAVATGVLTAGTVAFIAGSVMGRRRRAANTWH